MSEDIAMLQAKYKEVIGADAPNNKKNDGIWLMNKIDETLGVPPEAPIIETNNDDVEAPEPVPTPAPAETDPPKSASQEKREESLKGGKIPAKVQETGDDLLAQGLIGKFYSGDGEGGNWEMLIDKDGLSIKKLK